MKVVFFVQCSSQKNLRLPTLQLLTSGIQILDIFKTIKRPEANNFSLLLLSSGNK